MASSMKEQLMIRLSGAEQYPAVHINLVSSNMWSVQAYKSTEAALRTLT